MAEDLRIRERQSRAGRMLVKLQVVRSDVRHVVRSGRQGAVPAGVEMPLSQFEHRVGQLERQLRTALGLSRAAQRQLVGRLKPQVREVIALGEAILPVLTAVDDVGVQHAIDHLEHLRAAEIELADRETPGRQNVLSQSRWRRRFWRGLRQNGRD